MLSWTKYILLWQGWKAAWEVHGPAPTGSEAWKTKTLCLLFTEIKSCRVHKFTGAGIQHENISSLKSCAIYCCGSWGVLLTVGYSPSKHRCSAWTPSRCYSLTLQWLLWYSHRKLTISLQTQKHFLNSSCRTDGDNPLGSNSKKSTRCTSGNSGFWQVKLP